MWASAPTGRWTGSPFNGFPATLCRGRRPRRPASFDRPAPAGKLAKCQGSASGKRKAGYPGPPRAQGFPKSIAFDEATARNGQPSPAGGMEVRALRGPTRRGVLFFWTGRGPFVSGLSAAAYAAVGLRHAPAGAVFSARPNWVPARAQRSGSRGERRSKGSGRSFRIGAPAAPCAVGRAGAAE